MLFFSFTFSFFFLHLILVSDPVGGAVWSDAAADGDVTAALSLSFTAILFARLCALIKTPFEKLLLSDLTTPGRRKRRDDDV